MATDLFNQHHLSINQQEDADARDQYRIRKHDVPWRQMQRHLLFRWSIIEQIMKLSPLLASQCLNQFLFISFWDKMSQAILISVFITKLEEAFKKRKRKKKKRYFFFLVSRNYCFARIMHQHLYPSSKADSSMLCFGFNGGPTKYLQQHHHHSHIIFRGVGAGPKWKKYELYRKK